MPKQADLVPGTLELLILKAVTLGPNHGYGILLRINQLSGGALSIEQGALYLHSFAWSGRACSMPNGAPRRTTAAQSSTS